MPSAEQWWLFFGSALVFAFLPGPGMLYVLARSMRGGRADGLRSVAGNAIGASVHAIAAAVGLSALLAASAEAFFVVKILGACYLVYLGVQALRSGGAAPEDARPHGSAFVQGIVSEVLNPKTAVYFLAFLPHFVNPADPAATWAMILLGLISVLVASGADLIVALGAAAVSARLTRHPRLRSGQRWVSGLTLIGLGGLLGATQT